MKKHKKIHFVGIKGVGMTPLAIIAKEAGMIVTGSDTENEFITDEILKENEIDIKTGFKKENISDDLDYVIATGAHNGINNVEVVAAREFKIPVFMQGQAVGEFMKGKILGRKLKGISVTGCHGKTTTSAIISSVLKNSNMDPSYVIGTSSISSLGFPGHFGKGEYFVAEADEYATEPNYDKTPKFMWQEPEIAVFTNFDFDHPDLYKSEDEIKKAYKNFADKLKGKLIIFNGDDQILKELFSGIDAQKITFGFSNVCDYKITKTSSNIDKTFFWVVYKNISLGEFSISVPGDFNVLNSLPSIIIGLELGLSIDSIKKSLSMFSGSKRRLEYVGESEYGMLIYDDYAHHPTEIVNSLKTIKQIYPKKRLICVFQPHTYSRTKSLFEQFSRSFFVADELILIKIFSSEREQDPSENLSENLFLEISKHKNNIKFFAKFDDVIKYIGQKRYGKDILLVTMGAGDVYKIGKILLCKKYD